MATIENLYTGDGSTVLFSFTFEYIEEVDVEVSVDSVTIATTEYSLANSTTIEFNTAPASGAAIRIYRNTTVNNPKATFFPGSAIRAQDLNDNFEQILFVTQEADAISERAELAADQAQIATTAALAASATATTAATSAQVAASTAQAQVTAAQTSAASAAADANTAVTTANAAVATANTANTTSAAAAANAAGAATSASNAASDASAAQASAASAQSSATNATSLAASAQSSALSAQTSANNAATSATQAATDAATALSTSNSANSTAGNAATDASTALTAANNAVSTANAATATATTASSDAALAVSVANQAQVTSQNATNTANTAATDASSAVSTAGTALTTATTASSDASSALSTATTAETNAAAAVVTANNADGKADTAITDSASAVSTATTADTNASAAVSTANTAAADATSAVSLSYTALADAGTAVSTANGAVTTANAAVTSANAAVTTANDAETKADAAVSAVSAAYLFTVVGNVAAIPSSPSEGDAVRVADSTGIENVAGIQNVLSGFVGDSGVNVEIIFTSGNWSFLEYTANDPDDRYGYPPFVDVTRQNTVDAATLSGVALNSTDLGTFTGNTISDASTIKGALQSLETEVETKADLVGGVVPTSQLPALAVTEFLGTVADQTAMLALTGQRGDFAIRTDTGSTFVLTSDGGSTLSDWQELETPTDSIQTVNGQTGTVVLGPSDVGAVSAASGGTFSGNVEIGTGIDLNTDGSATFAGDLSIENSSYIRVRTTGDDTSTAIQLAPDGSASFAGTVNTGGLSYTGSGVYTINTSTTNPTIYARNVSNGSVFRGFDAGSPSNPTSSIDANGSASFAGGVSSNKTGTGTVSLAGPSTTWGLQVQDSTGTRTFGSAYDGSTTFAGGSLTIASTGQVNGANQIRINRTDAGSYILEGQDNGVTTSLITKSGSATFDGVLTSNNRIVANQAGSKSGSATTFLNYTGDGSTTSIEFTADGSATFAGIVEGSRFTNATDSADPWLRGVNSSGTETFNVNKAGNVFSSGSATFAGDLSVSGTVVGRNIYVDGQKLDGIASGATNVTNNSQISNGRGYITGFDITTQTDSKYLRSNTADTASGDITFAGGLGAVTLSSGSDIRATTGNWTGEAPSSTGKLQYHNNLWYIQAQSGWRFRNGSGSDRVQIDTSGNLTATGNVTAYSDIRLKKDIELIPNALDKVLSLRGITFTDIESDERRTGVIAQEVQAVLPEAVMEGEEYLSVAYGNLVGVLIESIKELEARVRELEGI